ncbi:hypothetical protein M9H77_34833 [Catharanthus roseus]|uniref:Uncharacterized protein n=1 Tax=Catharanthus roseus TaxID=4058 RepID=A0ACB9ZMJ7_CATRO|nr:hypothetical protein M9H77_34833 [Catharanthus roseus]
MDSSDSTSTPATSSTVTTSSSDASSSSDPIHVNFHVLEINLISAQDLPQVSKSMHTYAIAWIHPRRKLTSCIDQKGHTNPTWNDRFAFCVDNEFLMSENAAVTIEIYTTSSWFKDILVGTVRVLIADLITPSAVNNLRFVALQIRRPSGKFQGKLNMGVGLMDGSKGSTPPFSEINPQTDDNLDLLKKNCDVFVENQAVGDDKIQIWSSYNSCPADEVMEEFQGKGGSMVNGSMCNGSELCSDVGPSASIVAAEIAQRSLPPQPVVTATGGLRARGGRRVKEYEDIGSSIVEEMTMEEATAKGLKSNVTNRWKKEVPFPPMYERDYNSEIMDHKSRRGGGRGHLRRHSDGGLFSCFGNAYGFEFTIVCGASNKPNFKENTTRSQKKRLTSGPGAATATASETTSAA